MSDPEGRRTLQDLVADRPERLFHVGRLDTDTDGLILLTNDGDFAQRLAHPSYEVDKTYVAEVDGRVSKAVLRQLRDGVTLDDGPVTVSSSRLVSVAGRAVDRRAGDPRGPQPDRAPAARPRRPPRAPTDPHRHRPRGARAPGPGRAARPDPRRARRSCSTPPSSDRRRRWLRCEGRQARTSKPPMALRGFEARPSRLAELAPQDKRFCSSHLNHRSIRLLRCAATRWHGGRPERGDPDASSFHVPSRLPDQGCEGCARSTWGSWRMLTPARRP